MCLVISLFCLFYFHVKSLNFIFYGFVKSIVHQSYDQSIGSIYTSVNLKGNQPNWVDELFNSRNNFWWKKKNKQKNSSSVNQHSLTFDTDLYSHFTSTIESVIFVCMGFTMVRPQLANINAHIGPLHIFYLVLKITHINSKYLQTDWPKMQTKPTVKKAFTFCYRFNKSWFQIYGCFGVIQGFLVISC